MKNNTQASVLYNAIINMSGDPWYNLLWAVTMRAIQDMRCCKEQQAQGGQPDVYLLDAADFINGINPTSASRNVVNLLIAKGV